MGSRNRQGCCCGGTARQCVNVANVCRGEAQNVLYVKDGKVKDDNGEWPLTLVPPASGVTSAESYWTTAPITFATNRWTNGDCTPRNGESTYHYVVGFTVDPTIPDLGAMYCELHYDVVSCGGALLYAAGGDSSEGRERVVVGYDDVTCDPVGGSFDFAGPPGLPPASRNAVVTFDVDDASVRLCGCRDCNSMFFPIGDVSLTYDVDYGGEKHSGAVLLKRLSDSSETIHGPRGLLFLGEWGGNVAWWSVSSCSNPSNDPLLYNAMFQCQSTNFLRWCDGDSGASGPHLEKRSESRTQLVYDLIDPGATPTKQGTITLIDADRDGFDGVCCSPCVLPKRDMSVSWTKVVKGEVQQGYDFTLKYVDRTRTSGRMAFQWASDVPFVEVYDPLHKASSFYPGQFPLDPDYPFGRAYAYNLYLDCDNLYYSPVQLDGLDFDPRTLAHVDYLTNRRDSGPPYVTITSDYTCDPFHFASTDASGSAVDPLVVATYLRIDEVEP